jgi:hypothetical protein
VTLPDGRWSLHGYADRLEVDATAGVVVDLKTGKYPPTTVARAPAARSLPARRRPRRVRRRSPARPAGGAELVQLRGAAARLKVQAQPPQPDARAPRPCEEQLMRPPGDRARSFVARPGDHCDRCAFQAICPATTRHGAL